MAKSFGSDNHSGVHPIIMQALADANHEDCTAYGGDEYTQTVAQQLKEYLGAQAVYFVTNGTGANITSLRALTASYQAIICADSAHINVNECGGTEKNVGAKLLTIPTTDGKIAVHQIMPFLQRLGDQHAAQPRVMSITQATEWGTVYRLEELREIISYAHSHNLYVHMDGARIYNAAASLGVSLKALTADLGIDVLSLGGTKNGMMLGEAVVFFTPHLDNNFQYMRMQTTQLISKMRFIAAQFEALFTHDLWLSNARQANMMAQLLAQELNHLDIEIVQPVETNAVFARIPNNAIQDVQKKYRFYTWDEAQSIVRLMTSFNTQATDVMMFVKELANALR